VFLAFVDDEAADGASKGIILDRELAINSGKG
jgi:hypothetical protein